MFILHTNFLCSDCKQYLISASVHLFLLYQMHCVDSMTSLIFPFGLFAVFGILYMDSLPFEFSFLSSQVACLLYYF